MKKKDRELLDSLKVSYQELSLVFSKADLSDVFASLKQEAAIILDKANLPPLPTQGALSLLMLYLFKGRLVHKDDIARVGSHYLGEEQTDWQVRHLSAQKGFYIIGKGDLIPDTDLTCPSGYHSLITLLGISPKFAAIKRLNLLSDDDFPTIKQAFDNRCAHCNSSEGKVNFRDNTITKLQRGHINPNLPLDKGNIIPLCDYCNRTYKDTYLFLSSGSIDRVNLESERVSRLLTERAVAIHGKDKVRAWI
jgi:hypothetical protein